MFLGEYFRTRDNKGRVFVPTNFREELVSGVIISKGFDEKCLFLFSKPDWQNLEAKIKSGPIAKKNTQVFARWFFSSAKEEKLDPQNRLKIPQDLSDYAGLVKDIVLVGVSDRIEVWSKESWEQYYSQAESQFMGSNATFDELGF